MRTAVKATITGILLAVVMAFSAGPTFAGWSWEDCPPASDRETQHASDTATLHVTGVSVPANDRATSANPGKKLAH